MFFPALLTIVSFVTHFLFFGLPAAVVFDEVYMGSFVSSYSTGAYYFDIHPPLAKLIEKFFGDLMGVSYNADFSTIGNALPWEMVLLRILPIIAGALLPIVIYYLCRQFNFSKLASFVAGALIILENSLLTQSRFILFDGLMILFGFTSILLYLMYTKVTAKKDSHKRTWLLVGSALLAAGAFSIKWTGLAFPLILFILEIMRVWKTKSWQSELGKFVAAFVVIGVFIYLSAFAVHFAYLTKTGPGDVFMTERFQKGLAGNQYENDPNLETKGFFGKVIELNYKMYDANKTLMAKHQYSSKWYTWPLMLHPVFYWQGEHGSTGNSYIYLLGNPLIYLLGTLSVLFLLVRTLFYKKYDKVVLLILIGYAVNFLPFALIGRVMFLYHYEAALVLSILAIAYVFEKFIREKHKSTSAGVLLVACLALFVFFAPLTYGLRLTDRQLENRMWLSMWR